MGVASPRSASRTSARPNQPAIGTQTKMPAVDVGACDLNWTIIHAVATTSKAGHVLGHSVRKVVRTDKCLWDARWQSDGKIRLQALAMEFLQLTLNGVGDNYARRAALLSDIPKMFEEAYEKIQRERSAASSRQSRRK